MSVQERRYLLWLLEKYRQGADVAKEAHATTPKKKVHQSKRGLREWRWRWRWLMML